jgi:hypothetical protein
MAQDSKRDFLPSTLFKVEITRNINESTFWCLLGHASAAVYTLDKLIFPINNMSRRRLCLSMRIDPVDAFACGFTEPNISCSTESAISWKPRWATIDDHLLKASVVMRSII